jgi:PAS domain S-box-containing protein
LPAITVQSGDRRALPRGEGRFGWAFTLALVLFLAIAAVCVKTIHDFVEGGRWVDHTNEVRVEIEELEAHYFRLRVPWRDYLLTGEPASLAEFIREADALQPALDNLKTLVRDNATQQNRLAALARFLEQDMVALRASIAKRQAGILADPAEEIVRVTGRELRRHEIAQLIFDIRSQEETLLAQRRAQRERNARAAYAVIVGGNIAGFAMLITIFVLLRRENRTRRAAQDLAQRAAAEIEDLYNNAPCGYHSLDADGVFVRINDTELKWLGYEREEMVGRMRFSDLLAPASLARFSESLQKLKETGQVSDVEYELKRRDGTVLPVSLSATVVRDAAGDYVMSRSIMFDMTERRRASERIEALNAELRQHAARLEATNKELESFSYSVSHDLRTPLRAIDGFSRIVEEDYAGKLDDEGRRVLAVIRNNARKMGQLIDDLLEFSRLGRKPLAVSSVDMTLLARDVVDKLECAPGRPQPKVEVPALPPAQCDPALIRQVWVNLISNAVKFSGAREDPRVKVDGRSEGEEHVYSVSDNGAGFDMRYYDKLFGVFQRLHSAEEFPGTGVGLAIVQRVVARHGGRVWAEGEVGRGATFYFSLPKGEQHA